MLAMNPNNKDHFIYTKPPMTYQSMDGGLTYESLNHSNIFHAGIDRKGALTLTLTLNTGVCARNLSEVLLIKSCIERYTAVEL